MKKMLRFAGLTLSATFVAAAASAQTTFLNETFSGTTLPAGWNQVTLATDGGWKFGTAASNSSQSWTVPAHDGNMAATNDDACNCNKSEDHLITPAINLTTAANAILSFDCFFNQGSYQGATESFKVQVSTNGGTSWTDIAIIPGATSWTTRLVNLADYLGQTIQLSFTYNDGSGWTFGSAIDNVKVQEVVNYDLAGINSNIQEYVLNNTPLTITGTLRNFGGTTITAMRLNYQVNGGTVVSQNLTGLNIAATQSYNFSHGTAWTPNTIGNNTIKIWADELNGNADQFNSNDTIYVTTFVAEQLAQRKVFYEQFTSSTCGPCASAAPTIATFLDNNGVNTPAGKTVSVKYHVNIPSSCTGTTTETQARQQYYGVNSAPAARLGGNAFAGHPLNITQAMVDSEYDRPTIFSVTPTGSFNNNDVSISVDVTSFINTPANQNRLHVVVFENDVPRASFTTASTSQQNFKHVVRKMLPNANGTTLPAMNSGQTQNYTFTHTMNNLLAGNMNNVSIVAFVQNHSTREVYQVTAANLTGNVGLTENAIESSMLVYPNPASDFAIVTFNAETDNAVIEVVNALGQTVYTESLGSINGDHFVQLPTAQLSEGLYFVNVRTSTGSATKRLSVVK
jgi:thiol-disulfide isomerase/thioredoxin